MNGQVTNIQRFSLHDGSGIRTTVFLKGCNMRCLWCHNPEALQEGLGLLFYPQKCIGCGACVRACPQRIVHLRLEDNPIVVLCSNKDAVCRDVCEVSCIACGLCAKVCPAEAIKVSENRAFIYSDLCLSCGACAMACPRHVIHDKRGILTPRV